MNAPRGRRQQPAAIEKGGGVRCNGAIDSRSGSGEALGC
ncbi:hypothetical protein E9232_004859 [Inquilinus ginsengisoli]|uniref:Uncharacterized protein n=1 Tax=Inquilinus ginsengisoli TaxID=363840 RepID=A0ABU1JWD1_9PROT|nr:hypothetical protein [Inquilinus ginsengisoli]